MDVALSENSQKSAAATNAINISPSINTPFAAPLKVYLF
jgi:hypothetical protein